MIIKQETPDQKYAYAEIINGDARENWFLPIQEKGSFVAKTGRANIRKESQVVEDDKYGAHPWVEPRLAFADLLAWLDMNIWHKRCVYVKAAVIAGLGWQLVTDDEDKEPDAAYDLIMDFLNHPNEDRLDTFDRIAFKSVIDLESTGNFFNEVNRSFGGMLANMYHVRAMNFRRSKDARKGGYYQVPKKNYSKRWIEFCRFGMPQPTKNEVLHYYTYDPSSDYYGLPVWVPALADMVLDRSAAEFNINLFRNQLVAKFAVIVEGGKLSPTAKNSLREFLSSQAQGAKNAGKTIIFDTDDPNVKVRIDKLEMEFGTKNDWMGKIRESARDMIISAHGVPPRMVGVVTAGQLGGGSEAAEQLRIFEETEAGPKRARLEEFYNRTLLTEFSNHKWKLKFNSIDTTDAKVDADIQQILISAGIKLPEESRQDLGLPALDEEAMQRLGTGTDPLEEQVKSLVSLRKRLEQLDN